MKTRQRILVVDDEPDIREGVCRWLVACGYDTVCAGDGELGFELARVNVPDAILLDMLMPKKDGIQTLAELRACPATHNVPVVMLSASLRDEQRALEAGAKYFVHKPYSGKQLILTIRAAANQQ